MKARLLAALTVATLWPIVWAFNAYDQFKAAMASNVWED